MMDWEPGMLLCGLGGGFQAERIRNLTLRRISKYRPRLNNLTSLLPNLPSMPELPAVSLPRPLSRSATWSNFRDSSRDTPRPGRKHLPVGTGPHTVGCLDLMAGHTVNGVFIRLYYPTHKTDVMKREAQWPLWLPRKQYSKGYAYFRRKNTKVFGTLLYLLGGDFYVPVLWQAPVLDSDTKFPVIIFTHGLGGNRTTYTTVCSDLASHGYIVAAIEHRDGTASLTYHLHPQSEPGSPESDEMDYRYLYRNFSFQEERWLFYERQENEEDFNLRNGQIYQRAEAISSLLDTLEQMNKGQKVQNVVGLSHFDLGQFKDTMDFDRVAVVGHSFGGAAVVSSLDADKRLKCGVSLDGWMRPVDDALLNRVKQPILCINDETFQWKDNVIDMYKLKPNEDNKMHRILLTIKGTCHQTQSDFQFMVNKQLGKFLGVRDSLSPSVAMDINQKATLGFLAKHLDIPNQPHHEDILSGDNVHLIVGTNLNLNDPNEKNEPTP